MSERRQPLCSVYSHLDRVFAAVVHHRKGRAGHLDPIDRQPRLAIRDGRRQHGDVVDRLPMLLAHFD